LDLPIDAQEEDDSEEAERDQRMIDALMESERPSEPVCAKKSTAKVALIETDTFADLQNRKEGTVLHGMKSAPAHQAWLERGATEEAEAEESRQSTPAIEEE